MEVKILEVRDAGTMIPLLCVNLGKSDNKGQHYLMRRMGYPLDGEPNIAVCHLNCNNDPMTNDPYQQTVEPRTYRVAHHYIIEHWGTLSDGDVVDVQFILGEHAEKKRSERFNLF